MELRSPLDLTVRYKTSRVVLPEPVTPGVKKAEPTTG